MSALAARTACAMAVSAPSFCSVEASASTRAAAFARRPIPAIVAATSLVPSMVFSGADMVVGRYAQTGDFATLYHVLGPPVMPPQQGLPCANGPQGGLQRRYRAVLLGNLTTGNDP